MNELTSEPKIILPQWMVGQLTTGTAFSFSVAFSFLVVSHQDI